MRENIIVMVGGRSGGGKTSIIDFLVKNQGERYARPLSYTSRLKRNGEGCEEYNFISEEKMILMRDEGRFLNFDCVYGNYYAIAKKSIDVINTEGKVPIKEIHPSNQAKIKLCYPNAVSVLIKEIGMNGEEKRIGREKADTEYYENLNEDKFDVVFANDKRLTVEENAKEFGARVYSYIKYRAYFPPICDMDRLNRKGYAMIAEEFTEKKRVTTHNFHTLSADFFQDSINKFVYQGCKVLEVGPGRGWMRKTCSWPIVTYDVLELTEEMARFLDANEKIISSAARTMIASNKYQVEVCSLADPYFHTETLCELHRILAPGGVLAFTLPSVDWSENLRGDEMTTTFISENGDKAVTYSLVFEAEKIVEILQDCGFKEIKVNEITGKKLMEKNEYISPAITMAAENKKCKLDELKIITTVICKK